MIYSLIIQASPNNTSTLDCALKFSQALLKNQHTIYRLFFYGDGVFTADQNRVPAQDDLDIYQAWRQFIAENNVEAIVCIAAAIKRGILDETESSRYTKNGVSLAPEYTLSGLGQLIEASACSDKLITFA